MTELTNDVEQALKIADEFLRNDHGDQKRRIYHLENLRALENRLNKDIQERLTTYLAQLSSEEDRKVQKSWQELRNQNNKKYNSNKDDETKHRATFEQYRLVNDGRLPRNISPVLYSIPLIGVGVAEWYVNYSTFAAAFVPLVAIFGTLIVGAIFAVASHLHGAYLKQLPALLDPSTRYRNVVGRKIAVAIVTFCLLVAFGVVLYLRYSAIAGQLGIGTANSGTFGQPSGSLVWSRLGPTLVFNIGIWALGTLYSWAMHERVPELRESYRELQRASRKVQKAEAPFVAEEKTIRAEYDKEREKNRVAIRENQDDLKHVEDMIQRLAGTASETPSAKSVETSR